MLQKHPVYVYNSDVKDHSIFSNTAISFFSILYEVWIKQLLAIGAKICFCSKFIVYVTAITHSLSGLHVPALKNGQEQSESAIMCLRNGPALLIKYMNDLGHAHQLQRRHLHVIKSPLLYNS